MSEQAMKGAVEAAAHALANNAARRGESMGWKRLDPEQQRNRRHDAEEALTAALPFLMPGRERPWRVMTIEEYRSFFVRDKHIVQFDYDTAGNVAVWLIGDPQQMTEAALLCGLKDAALLPASPEKSIAGQGE